MTEPSHDLKNLFESNYKLDLQVAKCSAALHLESLELPVLDPDQIMRKLNKECDHSDQEIGTFPRKEYLKFGHSKDRHFNAFFSHYIFDHRDEEPFLMKGLVMSEKHKQLRNAFKKYKFDMPPLTLRGFLKGEYNVIFYELNQKPPGTSKSDYFKMRTWLIMRKQECVNLLLDQFIKRFFVQAGQQDKLADQARAELKLLKEIRNAHQYSPENFIFLFMSLWAIDPQWLPENATEFHHLYCQFLQGHDFSPGLNPPMLRSALKQVRTGQLSPVPLCCWTLVKYEKWLTCLLNGKIDPKNPHCPSCEQLFDQNYQQAIEIIEGLKAEFKENNPSGVISAEKYKLAIFTELKRYSLKYNQLQCLDYFHFISEMQMAKSYFINNCLLDIDMENQACELRTTIVIHEMVKFFENELCQIDKSLIKPFGNIKKFKKKCDDLFNTMILNPKLMDQFWWAFKRTSEALSGHKPLLLIAEDLKDAIRIIFNKALIDLNKLLDQQPGNLIAIYALQQIKHLDIKMLEAQDNDLNVNEYFGKVKNLFKVHLDFVESMEKHLPLGMHSQSHERPLQESPNKKISRPKRKTKTPKILAFNYKDVNDKLALVLKALIELGAVSADLTVPQFRAIYNGKNVTCPVEWLGSLGDLAIFIKESIRINGRGFTSCKQPWKIAEKCFVLKGGMAIDPRQLRFSKPTMLEHKYIDAARKFR